MTDDYRPRVLACPLSEQHHDAAGCTVAGCSFTVRLQDPPDEYRPNWLPAVRQALFSSEHAETWSAEFREHLKTAHTPGELLEYVTWEPHRIWTENESD